MNSRLLRRPLPLLLLLIFGISFAIILYVSNRLYVRYIDMRGRVPALSGKTAAVLSDLHLSANDRSKARELSDALHRLAPDMIILLGDYVPWGTSPEDYRFVFNFLRRLNSPLGIFAVLGDADYQLSRQSCGFCHTSDLRKPTPLNHVQFVRDACFELDVEGKKVRICGLESGESLKPKIAALSRILKRSPAIVLSHTSLIYDKIPADTKVLVLSGDTHGGQVYLPQFVWRLWKRKPDPEHMYGFFADGKKMLYVTSGTGTSGLPFRFGVPPEIVVLQF